MPLLSSDSGADFSPCRKWRYRLWREWDAKKPMLNLIGCNPSDAAEIKNDNTATKVIKFAKEWGFGRLEITNLYAWVATDPEDMKKALSVGLGVVGPDNDSWLLAAAKAADMVVCAWGMNGHALKGRPSAVEHSLRLAGFGSKLYALKLCGDGTPGHPLYLRGDLKPFPLSL